MLNPKLRKPLIGLSAAVVVSGAFIATQASAAPQPAAAPKPAAAPAEPSLLAAKLDAGLGSRDAGSYVGADGKLVVNVTDDATAAEVTAAGATPRRVERSGGTLASAEQTLLAKLKTPGTSFALDPVANQIAVTADSSVKGAELAKVRKLVKGLGAAARLEIEAGRLAPHISGGDAIYAAGGGRCSLGFNVKDSSGAFYFLTAGHCTNISQRWTDSSGRVLGTSARGSFPTNDYGIVKYSNNSIAKDGSVANVDITGAATPAVGTTVYRRGSTTGTRSGRVTGLNATVNYAEGAVRGLIRTTVCAQPGDSGGSLYGTNGLAYGLTSGGSGNCRIGGTTYYQPVTEALSVYGVSVY